MKKNTAIILILLAYTPFAFAQHDMKHQQHKTKPVAPKKKTQGKDQPAHIHKPVDTSVDKNKYEMGTMSSAFSKNLPMNRNGSGTSWLPDASPVYGYMTHKNDWMFMLHGNLFIRYNNQDFTGKGSRGSQKWDAPNYVMAMGQRRVGKRGLFYFSTMFSADALIAGGSGYPLLFQSGESWNGVPLVDRQHPHDLFAEIAVGYSYSFSEKSDVFIYLGYPGEPSIGSVVFMHRPSAMFGPDAPISHHWNDGSHITFGVATIGYRYSKFKIEASSFTGREPDENRYNFDRMRFDSWSGRLSYNPSNNWAFQVSNGYIKSPEALDPHENIIRTTASSIYSYTFLNKTIFNATALWAQNKIEGEGRSNAALLEANIKFKRLAPYARYEWVQKSGEELNLDGTLYEMHSLYPVNAITLGAGYDLFNVGPLVFAAGGQLSLYHADSRLDNLYGKNPVAGEIYLHVYPGLLR